MALATHPATSELRRVPSLLYLDPSALDTESNYGTLFGFTRGGINVLYNWRTAFTRSEEAGARPTAEWYLGEFVQLRGTFQSVGNSSALAKLFPSQTSGADIEIPGTRLPGDRLDTTGEHVKVLVMPFDETATNPCFLGQYCTVHISAAAQSIMATNSDFEIPFVVNCFPEPGSTNNQRTAFIGAKGNASLL